VQTLHNNPQSYLYLTYILVRMNDQEEYIRTVAGITLKNNLRRYYKQIPEPIRNYMKNEIIQVISNEKRPIRRAVAMIFTTIIEAASTKECPGLLEFLIQQLDSQDLNMVDGALCTLELICQDSAQRLAEESDRMPSSPLDDLVPRLLRFFGSEHESFRHFAVSCLNHFVVPMPKALVTHLGSYVRDLLQLSRDVSSDIRVCVCQGLMYLVETRINHVEQYLPAFIECVLAMTRDEDEVVALEAAEFWPVIAETGMCANILRPNLNRILPAMLDGMVYCESDLADFEVEEEEQNKPDRPQDIKPFIAGRRHDDDYDDDDDYEPTDWNLRKCSAAGLDIFANEFREEILPIVLPIISERLKHNDTYQWEVKESAILALGAIAEGTRPAIEQFLPGVIPFLLQHGNHPKPLIRSITCWALSRYGDWIVSQQQLIEPLLQLILSRLLDPNKRVQEAAVSALADLEETLRERLVPFLQPVCQALMAAYKLYQAKNLLILYDAIDTLAEVLGRHLNKPEFINILLPPLFERWNQLPENEDKSLFPLLECLMYLAIAIGEGFLPFTQPVFARCLRMIELAVAAEMSGQPNPPERSFIICPLDLITGLVEGLREKINPLIEESRLREILLLCMRHNGGDVRQSAFALVGEMAKASISLLLPYLDRYVPILMENFHPEHISSCNNAVWAIGEIAVRVGGNMQPLIKPLMGKLIQLMNSHSPRSLVENVAITIGRLGLVCPQDVAPYLPEFIQPWCHSLRSVRDDSEKDSAFKGLCTVIAINQQAAVEHVSAIADAITSWEHPRDDLAQAFGQILHSLKAAHSPDRWQTVYMSWPPGVREFLSQRYRI